MNFGIGQQLYFVPHPYSNDKTPRSLTIEKIGVRWLTLSNGYRADKDTLKVDGGKYSSPGRCWLSQQEYEDTVAVSKAWNKLSGQMRGYLPEGVTLAKIEEARRVLGMESDNPAAPAKSG